jgi:hypothetical protein
MNVIGTVRCLAIWGLVGWHAGVLSAMPPGQLGAEVAPAAVDEQVQQWIGALDADEFLAREHATESLVQAGASAVEPLLAALRDRQWEVNTRIVHILQQMALSGDPDVEEVARSALVEIAQSPIRSAAQRAQATLAGIGEIRQQRALAELVRLGAKTSPERNQFNFALFAIEIGEDWLGTERDVRQIRWLQDLQQVTLAGERVTNEWLEPLAELPGLSYLILKKTSVNDAGMEFISQLKRLRIIEIRYVDLTDDSLDKLAQLNSVAQFRLYGTGITPEGAARLRERTGADVDHRLGAFLGIGGEFHPLGCLVVEVRPQTAAAAGGLQSGDVIVSFNGERVAGFPALTALIAQNVPGDMVKVEFLRHAESRKGSRPIREGDRLGIVGKPHRLGCEVTQVQEDSVAKIMGMEPGDVVVRFNGQEIDDPATLAVLFEAALVGENASFEFLRRVDLKEIEVKLGRMD